MLKILSAVGYNAKILIAVGYNAKKKDFKLNKTLF